MEPDTEEQFSSQTDDSCEMMELDVEDQFSSQNNDSCEGLETESVPININVDYNLHRIPINGVEDMGGIDFKKFTTIDIMKYDFPNLEVAFTFYNWYARMHGFAGRKNRKRKNKHNEVVQQEFVCYMQGFRKDRFKENKKRVREVKAITRCGCRAKCVVHVDSISQRWCIRFIDDVHNHPFVEQEFIMFLPGHRGMDDDDILQMNYFKKSGIRTSQVFGTFANQVGGYEHVTFSLRDMYNVVDKERRSKGTDSRAALAYLRSLKSYDPTMYWKHTVDKEGVNHHNQTTVFATTVVANEIEETYVWLLECLLEAMNDKMPKSVITDVDFERKWNEMVNECGVHDNHWVLDMYEKKEMWATSHIREYLRYKELEADYLSMHGDQIPSTLVLDRWTKNAKDLVNYTRQGQSCGWDSMSVCRYKSLNQRCREINSLVCKNPEAYAETMEILNDHYGYIKSKYELQLKDGEKIEGHSDRYLQNPVTAKTKGRGGNVAGRTGTKRKKSQCGFCGIVGHNKQNCGVFKKQESLVDKSKTTDDDDDDGKEDEDEDEDDVGGDDDDDDEDYRG
ncbi:hypothetical protein TSUD_275160 [Trifolium subterraneum]|uniref:FAR1 domain-containing protein n=1 Tax=Trifolium subterraneum TaxID=3900 RepID=A0A2Z6P146_TRISU|nr:hypothetical protein TSUD_275160 [Trifolium subterraneum]